ncbi:MAG: IscS subfamily cysteine desulfurase [Gammaproteobacteria bacterium]|nr:IscS subfamily cysteine desulfurase [Gammaproteobacteria bacterium]MYH15696.1 IscS subfamily cysteine desulfurase [Gammaproteobacteria bacterium]MYK84578.1 IscS subfamily cysteine desulfurase [Gammaproteobacteria bacterium]
MRKAVYLDYSATTPVDPQVAAKMNACLLAEDNFGNPASRSHTFGWHAEEAVEAARADVARLLNADPREIVWTSGATESDNLAIKGLAEGASRRHIVTSAIEHKAVLDTCAHLEAQGFEVTWLVPPADGIIRPDQVAEALREDTLLVSLMHVNNEIGVVNDVAAIGQICRAAGVRFHVDAAQSAGKLPLDVQAMAIDLISLSAHKMYGPKGVGALYVRREPPMRLRPQMHGGGHERGMRSGTLATHQVVGMGEACAILGRVMETENARILALRKRLWSHLKQAPGAVLNGDEDRRLPGNLNVGFAGIDGETLLMALDDVAVSSGSACTSASIEPSYVLSALGVPDEIAHASLRFTIGRFTTEEEVDYAARRVVEVVSGLRAT